MKALILAGGRGKRLEDVTRAKNKCMIEISGKPLIAHSLDCVSKLLEVSEIIIVVGYQSEQIINAFGQSYKGKPIKYVFQKEQKGLVHAIDCAKEALGKEDFILMLGDELMINPKHVEMIEFFEKEGLFALCGALEVENKDFVKKTYALWQGIDGRVLRLVEKPQNPINNIMGTGNCLFRNEILSYIPKTPINQNRDEKELPDLIQCAIDDGKIVKPFIICDQYFNINFKEEMKNAKSYFAHFSENDKNLL